MSHWFLFPLLFFCQRWKETPFSFPYDPSAVRCRTFSFSSVPAVAFILSLPSFFFSLLMMKTKLNPFPCSFFMFRLNFPPLLPERDRECGLLFFSSCLKVKCGSFFSFFSVLVSTSLIRNAFFFLPPLSSGPHFFFPPENRGRRTSLYGPSESRPGRPFSISWEVPGLHLCLFFFSFRKGVNDDPSFFFFFRVSRSVSVLLSSGEPKDDLGRILFPLPVRNNHFPFHLERISQLL